LLPKFGARFENGIFRLLLENEILNLQFDLDFGQIYSVGIKIAIKTIDIQLHSTPYGVL